MIKRWNKVPGDSLYTVYLGDDHIWYLEDKELTTKAQNELSIILKRANIQPNDLVVEISINWLADGSYDSGSRDTPPDLEDERRLAEPISYNIKRFDKHLTGKLSIPVSIEIFQMLEDDIRDKNPPDHYIYESYFERALSRVI
jgi:hypothetical protein